MSDLAVEPGRSVGAGRMSVSLPGDPRGVRTASPADLWQTLVTGARLGWAIEANWSDPVLFAIYSIAKPLGAALILVAMVTVVAGSASPPLMGFVIVGSAAWNFVGGALAGLVQSILDDRERYRMLKYVFLTPASLGPFLIGRGAARLAAALAGALLTLGVGVLLLGVRIDLLRVDWLLLALSMTLGLVAVAALGIGMAGLCIQLRQDAWSYPEALAGALYLLAGAIFPIDVLPEWLRAVSVGLPLTWWLEGVRRALLGSGGTPVLAAYDDLTIVLALLATTAALTLVAWAAFRFFERRARERGLIDQLTGS